MTFGGLETPKPLNRFPKNSLFLIAHTMSHVTYTLLFFAGANFYFVTFFQRISEVAMQMPCYSKAVCSSH